MCYINAMQAFAMPLLLFGIMTFYNCGKGLSLSQFRKLSPEFWKLLWQVPDFQLSLASSGVCMFVHVVFVNSCL